MSSWIPGRGGKWDIRPLRLLDLKASLGRWQAGLAETRLEQPLLGQPRPAARRVPVRRRRRIPGGIGETAGHVLHLHRGTPYVYQGEELGMTNVPFAGCRPNSGTSNRSITIAAATAAGDGSGRGAGRVAAAQPGQRAHPDAVGRRPTRRIHHRRAVDSRSIRITPRSTLRAQVEDPDSVFAHYRAVIDLRHADPVVAYGDFTMLLPDDPPVYAFTRSLSRQHPAGRRQLLRRAGAGRRCRTRTSWAAAELVLGNYPDRRGRSGCPDRSSCGRGSARIYR